MAFVLKQSDTYVWPVTFDIPVDGGRHEKQTFDGERRRLHLVGGGLGEVELHDDTGLPHKDRGSHTALLILVQKEQQFGSLDGPQDGRRRRGRRHPADGHAVQDEVAATAALTGESPSL